jgi:hypothetical protein
MSNLTPFEYAEYSKPPKEMVGCFLNDNNIKSYSNFNYFFFTALYGFIYGSALFLFNVFFMELYGTYKINYTVITVVTLIISTLIIYLRLKSYRDRNFHIEWKTGLIVGGIIGLIYSAASSSMNYIYFNLINPSALDTLLNNLYQGSTGGVSLEMFKETYIRFQLPGLLYSVPIGLLTGAVLSLIPTYLLKLKKS